MTMNTNGRDSLPCFTKLQKDLRAPGRTGPARSGAVRCGAIAAMLLALAVWPWQGVPARIAEQPAGSLEAAQKLAADGNHKEAYQAFEKLATDPKTDPAVAAKAVAGAVQAMHNLGTIEDLDGFLEKTVEAHPKAWQVAHAVGVQYRDAPHFGYRIAGRFNRGWNRSEGSYVSCIDRDRVRSLQLFAGALDNVAELADANSKAAFYRDFAAALFQHASMGQAWKLQVLTDLAVLPDYEEGGGPWGWRGWGRFGGAPAGAPVDAEGNPVLHHKPAAWADAKSDGERWRHLLERLGGVNGDTRMEADITFADFLHSQFGVQTLAYYGGYFSDPAADSKDTGVWAIHTLEDDETIARLATGAKRFKLADEFNPLAIYKRLAAGSHGDYSARSADMVASTYEDRRQYVKAAAAWEAAAKKFPASHRTDRRDQIVKNWGRFEPIGTQPSGRGATADFRFRNATEATFTAHAIRLDLLLADVKAHLRSNAGQIDWNKLNVSDFGYRIVFQNETRYVGDQVAQWTVALKPRPNHVDDRITVTTPLQQAGAYLVTSKVKDGNTSRIIVWVADTVIVKKPLNGASYYYVGDAVSGAPIAKANVEFLGWKQEQIGNTNRFRTVLKNFAEFSDAQGQVTVNQAKVPNDMQWLVVARTDAGRLAYLGFNGIWYPQYYDEVYNQTKVFAITDRPVYRPEQTAKFKFWVQQAKYDQPDASPFAGKSFKVLIHNPQGEKVFEQQFTADKFGGLAGEFPLAKGCALGVYQLFIENLGGTSFRVEEYKKPEFEVAVEAPNEAVMLGEKVTAKIKAKYYFGAPVSKGTVHYKVLRSEKSLRWYPVMPWDWLYGNGYWWFSYDYAWYPGWERWGCLRPVPFWWGWSPTPPELVMEGDLPIGANGELAIEIDTALAKLIHGDQDHDYAITAEVTDESRRMIVGQGSVVVARQPFKVFGWVHRGHYRAGDTVEASFSARTADGKPVAGKGTLKLLRIKYAGGKPPEESVVETWPLDTNEEGVASQKFVAAEPGQYRLSYSVTDAKERTEEGGYLFVVAGRGFDGREYRFSDLELVADKREYAPGEKVQLMVNTNRVGSTVVLFVRPANGVYLPPKVIKLAGKSLTEEIAVIQKDMPNFFVEAFTIADGKVHQEVRELFVPPEKRVMNVEVATAQKEYLPGAPAKLQIKVTDLDGKPIAGSTVLTMYDRAVEYISGGSNVPDIKEFFWKWRRSHYPSRETTLDRGGYQLLKQNEVPMQEIGVFGADVIDQLGGPVTETQSLRGSMRKGGPPGGLGGGFGAPAAAGAPAEGADRLMNFAAQSEDKVGTSAGPGGAPPVEPVIRQNFADTALWVASVETNSDGLAEIDVTMPENLTAWKIRAWSLGLGAKVGEATTEVTTKKNLLLRMQSPRFFTEKDEVVLSANIHNDLAAAKTVTAVLETDGPALSLLDEATRTVEIAAHGELRVDWRVKVLQEGEAVIRMKALTDEESDAMQMKFPVYVHGMLKTESFSGVIRPDKERASVEFRVPAERRPDQSRVELRYSPTLAGAMVDALPYLAEYPYGCTEQTLNRFLPSVITQRILVRMNLDLQAIGEKRTNLNAQEIGDDRERAKRWKRFDRNPVFEPETLADMVKEGVQTLTSQQLSDGGWGWFSGYGEHSYPHTTAVVVHGLQVAKLNDVALVPGTLEAGVEWLKRYQAEQIRLIKNAPTKTIPWKEHADNLDAFIYMILADADHANAEMLEFLYRDRNHLSVYAKACYGLALHKQQQAEKLAMILRNIEQYVVEDNENQTAYLRLPENDWWWYWYGSEVEANTWYLKLLARTDPKGDRASRLVKYLLNNRKHATYWNSTRDTALAIEALAEFLAASGEDRPNMTVELFLDGQKIKEVKIDHENLFTFDNKLVLEGNRIESGKHQLEVRRTGSGPVYFNAYVTNFTLEDDITAAGLEVKVDRKFYKLTRVDDSVKVAGSQGQAVDQKVEKYERTELPNLASLKSGDLIEIELIIESKNDYEYLVFEDIKAAGCEPLDVRSGYLGTGLGAYVEFRDERVCFFVRQLPRGRHNVTYRTRAEIPGRFSALPTRASAMYAPELKANSDELKLVIHD